MGSARHLTAADFRQAPHSESDRKDYPEKLEIALNGPPEQA